MKVIAYSLFGDPDSFEFPFYLRGIYFNARMNRLIYPEWRTAIMIDDRLHALLDDFISALHITYRNIEFVFVEPKKDERCRKMLWRLMPLWWSAVDTVICRDADAITTHRESVAVESWSSSQFSYHGINDDSAHSIPMMGGMVGFQVPDFRRDFSEWQTWAEMVNGSKLDKHGTDQDLLMTKIYPRINNRLYVSKTPPSVRSNKLWESDLTCRMIGSPGVVDFELLRFFKRFDPKGESINNELRKLSPEVRKHFYWL